MANYTTNTSDITKKQIMKAWAVGLLGMLGFQYFKVGRIKPGMVRLLIGVLFLGAFVFSLPDPKVPAPVFLIVPAILSIVDLIRIRLGVFRDNVGNTIRE